VRIKMNAEIRIRGKRETRALTFEEEAFMDRGQPESSLDALEN
jgi:hypothetical protein